MSNVATQIMNQLLEVFAEFDDVHLNNQKVWVMDRKKAISKYKEETNVRTVDLNTYYRGLFAVAGGKTWYNIINGNTDERIFEFVKKNHNASVEKRNAKITKKLIESNVKSIVSQEYARSADGFDGVYRVDTDNGIKTITVNTIYAGGYNIQCAHMRCLVKVK